ncbi:hypothetical protein NA57DRAFT_72453 [Rhizodiscina lignyota]|uniref:Uncharacterized protein n=1 Tax=Rhizodiscina lignyota TaxID=1504668 RepID=A0A9P4IQF3_9PEZI|nr:hypothetical protein NA57DRAFT_72453 [Rhizodiscina lignyota]
MTRKPVAPHQLLSGLDDSTYEILDSQALASDDEDGHTISLTSGENETVYTTDSDEDSDEEDFEDEEDGHHVDDSEMTARPDSPDVEIHMSPSIAHEPTAVGEGEEDCQSTQGEAKKVAKPAVLQTMETMVVELYKKSEKVYKQGEDLYKNVKRSCKERWNDCKERFSDLDEDEMCMLLMQQLKCLIIVFAFTAMTLWAHWALRHVSVQVTWKQLTLPAPHEVCRPPPAGEVPSTYVSPLHEWFTMTSPPPEIPTVEPGWTSKGDLSEIPQKALKAMDQNFKDAYELLQEEYLDLLNRLESMSQRVDLVKAQKHALVLQSQIYNIHQRITRGVIGRFGALITRFDSALAKFDPLKTIARASRNAKLIMAKIQAKQEERAKLKEESCKAGKAKKNLKEQFEDMKKSMHGLEKMRKSLKAEREAAKATKAALRKGR